MNITINLVHDRLGVRVLIGRGRNGKNVYRCMHYRMRKSGKNVFPCNQEVIF